MKVEVDGHVENEVREVGEEVGSMIVTVVSEVVVNSVQEGEEEEMEMKVRGQDLRPQEEVLKTEATVGGEVTVGEEVTEENEEDLEEIEIVFQELMGVKQYLHLSDQIIYESNSIHVLNPFHHPLHLLLKMTLLLHIPRRPLRHLNHLDRSLIH